MKTVIEILDIKHGHLLLTADTEVEGDVKEAAEQIAKFSKGGAVFAGRGEDDLSRVKADTVADAERIVRESERILCVPQFKGG